MFSIVLISEIESNNTEVSYTEEIQYISNKLKELKTITMRNFSINAIVLEDNKQENRNIKSISFFYEISSLCLGYFFAPKNLDELAQCLMLILTIQEQTILLNLKAIIKGNRDPVKILIKKI